MEKPLRILVVVNLPWDPRLGAVRVWTELSEQWRKAGQIVEKFCLTDAFPKPTNSRGLSALRQVLFPHRAARYVQANADRFDVIDCLIGTLPFSKKKLRFQGLLVGRSVGLYRSYEHFIRSTRERWPDQPRGKFLGRFFYRFTVGHLRKNSDRALRHCDLVNLPNEEELQFLQATPARNKPVIVQPYGLNERNRAALAHAIPPAEERLKQKEICFIGMWGLRKGARDWTEIIRHVRSAIPGAQFTFLGTMTDEATVLKDLRLSRRDGVRCVATYNPEELPALLAPCAVGLFPSYIEGFGIAVLEQLACGIPTVAYDVPGPRQIFGANQIKLLTPAGDTKAMADRAVEILTMSAKDYSALFAQCRSIAGQFRWEQIAGDTLQQYRAAISNLSRIVFTQPFGVASPIGGARILRSLLQDSPIPHLCVCTSPWPPTAEYRDEVYIPTRPSFGRIERTRFMSLPHALAPLFRRRFVKKLEAACVQAHARALHAIAHGGLDFYHAYRLSRKLRIPFFLQVHDDVAYTGAGRAPQRAISTCLAETWREADVRFVISNELGHEYNRRYGTREFVVVTDGLDRVAPAPRPAPSQLRIYFMGLFHLEYERNLEALIEALELLSSEPDLAQTCSITLRCHDLRPALRKKSRLVRVLPFGSDAELQKDFDTADLLYLPLPFGEQHRALGAYSLSTKMVTYLGTGIPILYHGPVGTAAHNLLSNHRAAALVTSLDAKEIARSLSELLQGEKGPTFAGNALELAAASFVRNEQQEKFWDKIVSCLNELGAAQPAAV
ncbi:MAG TPA: glycosyltransferase [Chthoniobacterales bacterium]|nr:glycosyltransferase [Chthoniobacterales bacterium]